MRRFTLFILTAIAVVQLSSCVVTDRTTKMPRPKTEKTQPKVKKESKKTKKTKKSTPQRPKTDANTGASRRM